MKGNRTPPAKPVDREAGKQHSVPGPKSKAIFEREAKVMAPGLQSIALYSQIAVDRANGCVITDADGKEYLDFNSGQMCGALGHNHPTVTAAIKQVAAQFLPEPVEIWRNGSSSHPLVEIFQDRHSDSLIGDLQGALQWPFHLNASSRPLNRAHRILESQSIAGALPDFDVGKQTVQSPAPIGPAPRMGKIEPAIIVFWQSLRHRVNHITPDLLRR